MVQNTALTQAHQQANAKMVEFAGYNMPIQYPLGIMKEHEWVRSEAGIFDVSHMGQLILKGSAAADILEHLTPSGFKALPLGKCKYTVLTNEKGGVIDDLIVTRLGDETFYLVVNASRKEGDEAWIAKHLVGDATLERFTERSLIAVQGPKAEAVLQRQLKEGDLSALKYMNATTVVLKSGVQVLVSRTGYTGEDGFEVSLPDVNAPDLWNGLLKEPEVNPIGLGARDSLRLEMGYPLYGHDLSEDITPVEGGLSWVIAKDNKDYHGADVIRAELADKPKRQRIGLILNDRGVVREGAPLFLSAEPKAGEQPVGEVCSGGFSPSLQKSIAMGYVKSDIAASAQLLYAEVRGKRLAAQKVGMPFYQVRKRNVA
ncbi:glycine cleavage system aminomethyltransferase GcvT [bacterium]|nr:glycine cleavage system aminomethyltransferase GcvT [bacterium]